MTGRWFRGILFTCLVTAAATVIADDLTLVDYGQSIYRTSTTPDGRQITAFVQGDVPLPAGANACINCHRRSGLGISEGGSRSLNLTAAALFNASDKPPLRPAYNDQTLLRAIIGGVSASGRPLNATMPRYQLSAKDGDALLAYLHTLGATLPGGLDDSTITLATVISDQAPSNEREAVVQVTRKFVEQKNSESRHDSERAAASNRHAFGRNRQRSHRTWDFRIWTLHGKASTWSDQLNAYHADHPVFALVSGTTGSDWNVVHDFCERTEVPCVLPLDEPPANPDNDFYSLYFSAGLALEASATAQHIARTSNTPDRKIMIVFEDLKDNDFSISELQRKLAAAGNINVKTVAMPARKDVSWRQWRSMLRSESPDVVVAWVSPTSLANLENPKISSQILPPQIYTAHSSTDWLTIGPPPDSISRRIRHIYPYSLPQQYAAQFPRERLWLRQNGFAELDQIAAAKVLYACRVLGMGLSDIQTNFSREYFLESLEHALDGTELTSLFPKTSLGPNQRLLSRGAFVVEISRTESPIFTNAEWVQL